MRSGDPNPNPNPNPNLVEKRRLDAQLLGELLVRVRVRVRVRVGARVRVRVRVRGRVRGRVGVRVRVSRTSEGALVRSCRRPRDMSRPMTTPSRRGSMGGLVTWVGVGVGG